MDLAQEVNREDDPNDHRADFLWSLSLLFEQAGFIEGSRRDYIWLIDEFFPYVLHYLDQFEYYVRQDEAHRSHADDRVTHDQKEPQL